MLTTRGAYVLQVDSECDPSTGKIGGRIEHVLSGRATTFDSTDALLAFVGATTDRQAPADCGNMGAK